MVVEDDRCSSRPSTALRRAEIARAGGSHSAPEGRGEQRSSVEFDGDAAAPQRPT
jgi:hypothetical protein